MTATIAGAWFALGWLAGVATIPAAVWVVWQLERIRGAR